MTAVSGVYNSFLRIHIRKQDKNNSHSYVILGQILHYLKNLKFTKQIKTSEEVFHCIKNLCTLIKFFVSSAFTTVLKGIVDNNKLIKNHLQSSS